MNCNEAVARIAALADGELDPVQSDLLERHLMRCANCAAEHRELLQLRTQLREELLYHRAPSELRERVQQLGRAAATAPVAQRRRWLLGGALAGAMAASAAWLLGSALLAWRAGTELASEVTALHVRATLSHHLVDVASSDRHTVKPWLSSRLDYAPPVSDLAAEGLVLEGARLERLQQGTVATLVYRYREHHIDVFVRPQAGTSLPQRLDVVRGFNVAFVQGSGMQWIAVSDLNAAQLAAWLQRLADG